MVRYEQALNFSYQHSMTWLNDRVNNEKKTLRKYISMYIPSLNF